MQVNAEENLNRHLSKSQKKSEHKPKRFTNNYYPINSFNMNQSSGYNDQFISKNPNPRKTKISRKFASSQKKNEKQGIFKAMNQINFLNPYEKCKNLENFHVFKNLNLKFLKQNYKFKDNNFDDEKHFLKKEKEEKFEAFYKEKGNMEKSSKYNDIYYESLRLQPYTFIKDNQVIEENIKSGRYLEGVIRINKCHTHGYITVEGLVNDILIRGNRNLNQSLHLDEVIVELMPMVCWKPLFNKKTRKISNFEDDFNLKNENLTDIERERNDDYESPNQDITGEVKYKEVFESTDERLKYVNKHLNLRPEGRIVKIKNSINLEKNQIVTIDYEKSNNLIFATPIDENIPKIFIKMKKINRVDFLKKLESDYYFKKKYFIVKIVGWALNFKCPKGIITDELGNSGNIEVETDVLLRTYGIDYAEHSHNVIEESKKFEQNWTIPEEEFKKRVDLRNDIIFTIDPKNSKDLDDAISIKIIENEEKSEKLYKIGVHIADPSYFLTKDSLIDKEALNRATTVYLVHKNLPMLPRVFSENVCSLLPKKDRLSLSFYFTVNEEGVVVPEYEHKFVLSIMKSACQLSYETAQKLIDFPETKINEIEEEERPDLEETFNTIKENLKILNQITKKMRKIRIDNGSVILENNEVLFNLDKNSQPNSFTLKPKIDTNSLIEELMLKANQFCAELIYSEFKEKSLLRRHSFFNDNKSSEIQRYIYSNKLNMNFENCKDLNNCLDNLKSIDEVKFICLRYKLKFFMQRAEYVLGGKAIKDDLRHAALNFNLYTHFTSPIRRYPDIIVHRLLKQLIAGEGEENFTKIDERIIENFNSQYVNSKLISQKCQKLFHCMLFKKNPAKIYSGYVIDILFKNQKNNKRMSQVDISNLSIQIYFPDMNFDVEWKKEDQIQPLLDLKYNQNDNNIEISYRQDEQYFTKLIKVFDKIDMNIICIEKIPLELRCNIIFNN